MLTGDAADEELLLEENIDSAGRLHRRHERRGSEYPLGDAREAPRLSQGHGADQPARVRRADGERPIDVALSPQQVTIGSLLAHVRRGDVVRVHSLRRGAAEAIEAVAHGIKAKAA